MLTVTATNLPRLMNCNGSRLMGGAPPPVNPDDSVKDEGNAADWLVGEVHSGRFTVEELIDRKAPNGVYITPEMVEYLEEYLKWVMRGGHTEFDTSHACANWQINGRADHVLYDNKTKTLYISDLKYGWGIVEPEMNWTLVSHAISWIGQHTGHRCVETVVLQIFQPRPHHAEGRTRSWTIDREKLNELYVQINQTLSDPSDILNTGEHCYGCPSLAFCPAARKAEMNAIDASEKAFTDEIDNDNLTFQLDHLKRAKKVLEQLEKAYIDLAMNRLKQGEVIQNYAVENNLANRSWKSHVTSEFMNILTGEEVCKKTLITPKQAEGKGVSPEVVANLTERKPKGFKLVRVDANARAKKLFNQKEGN